MCVVCVRCVCVVGVCVRVCECVWCVCGILFVSVLGVFVCVVVVRVCAVCVVCGWCVCVVCSGVCVR